MMNFITNILSIYCLKQLNRQYFYCSSAPWCQPAGQSLVGFAHQLHSSPWQVSLVYFHSKLLFLKYYKDIPFKSLFSFSSCPTQQLPEPLPFPEFFLHIFKVTFIDESKYKLVPLNDQVCFYLYCSTAPCYHHQIQYILVFSISIF